MEEQQNSKISVTNVQGMGDVVLPGLDTVGSGDILNDTKKKRKKNLCLNFNEFCHDDD